MSKPEVVRVLSFFTGVYLIIAQLLYGCEMRISDGLYRKLAIVALGWVVKKLKL